MRVNQGQEFVIAGYTPSPKNFDAVVIGYYNGGKLIYAARTRNGFTLASLTDLLKKIKPLEVEDCPFANLPENKAGRWGARGVRHSVSVYASSVLKAAAAGLKQIRETEMIEDEGVVDLTVDLVTTTSHRISLSKLKAWLASSGHDPREAAMKTKLR